MQEKIRMKLKFSSPKAQAAPTSTALVLPVQALKLNPVGFPTMNPIPQPLLAAAAAVQNVKNASKKINTDFVRLIVTTSCFIIPTTLPLTLFP
jgi:hypothetical protein